jgi:IBR domain, a half RING-finger domain
MQTESMFPPKCCLTEIPLKDILTALNEPQKELYKSKAAEYSLKPESRWYCPNAKCGKWIPPGKLHKLRILGARCPGCYTRICGYCRGTSHEDGVDCPEDFGLEATIEEAERQGWRRCYKCRTLVELTVGCRHITCRCKAQFCYTCGAKWRTCSCTEVDQERRQAEIVERRNARSARSREEEEEIARAISEIEAMEHREAQERARETAERERIEALKRALEADERIWRERLESLEREKRRKEEEEAAQKREEAIRVSVTERIDYLRGALLEIQQFQQSSLISRHNNAAAALNEENHDQEAVDKSELDDQQVKLASNSALRHTLLQSAHESKVAELTSKHEAEEDDTFMSMQEHLRGKPNREARVKTALDKLQQRQKEVMNMLGEEHGKKTKLLKENVAMETKALEAGYSLRSEDRKRAFDESSITLKRTVVAERKLFEVVAERRKDMMAELQSRLWSDMEQVCHDHDHGSSAEGIESSSSSGTVAQGKQKVLVLPSFMEPASAALCPAVVGA